MSTLTLKRSDVSGRGMDIGQLSEAEGRNYLPTLLIHGSLKGTTLIIISNITNGP